MEHAGVAITITTITDLVAFTVASLSSKVFFVRFVYNCFWLKAVFLLFSQDLLLLLLLSQVLLLLCYPEFELCLPLHLHILLGHPHNRPEED